MSATFQVRRCWLLAAATVWLGAGCLPPDTRPTPGSVYVSAEPSEAVAHGFTTADGWDIVFDRLLVGLGDVSLDGDGCNSYSETHYDRLYDFAAGGQQKVGLVYGLGACELRFRMRSPSSDAVLGEGVSQSDVDSMRTEVGDVYVPEGRTTLYVRGHASRKTITKHFEWSFRHGYTLKNCPAEGDAGQASAIQIQGGDELAKQIVVRGEELLRPSADDDAPLRFDLLAEADADGDQAITLDELAKVPAPPPEETDAGADAGTNAWDASAPDGGALSLADVVYEALVPRIARLENSGACEAEARDRRR